MATQIFIVKSSSGVQAEAVAVMGSRKPGDVFGPWTQKKLLHGLVVDVIGCGHQRKFKVKWDECDCEAELSACSLEREEVLMSATQTWWHCLAATFFGVVVTDAFIAYNYEHHSEMTIRNFVKEVTISLLFIRLMEVIWFLRDGSQEMNIHLLSQLLHLKLILYDACHSCP